MSRRNPLSRAKQPEDAADHQGSATPQDSAPTGDQSDGQAGGQAGEKVSEPTSASDGSTASTKQAAAPTKSAKPAKPAPRSTATKEPERKGGSGGKGAGAAAAVAATRTRVAQLVWLVFVVCALLLAVGALLVALDANAQNSLVRFVLDGANVVDLGVFSRNNGIKEFRGDGADVKNALLNWGLGAVAYLVVGKILDRLIRP